MNKFSGFILMLSIVLTLAACSNNDKKEQNNENDIDSNIVEETNNSNETEVDDNASVNNNAEDVEEEANDEEQDIPEHQQGLTLGETGTVISGTLFDNKRYEITLNKIEQLTEVEGETNYNEIFIKANVTIENTEDSPLPVDSIFRPTVGDEDLEDVELFPEFKKEFYMEDGRTAFAADEIAPGEKVVVDYYFDTVKADYYRFAFGNPSDQIVTYANWKIKTADM